MYFKDRVPKYPNRKKIKFLDDGTERMATIEYADEPTEEGTPIDASTLDSIVPRGVILMWSGNENNIPDGWALCNGENGTPDLRDRFIVGAGGKYGAGETGGSEAIDINHSHSYSGTVNETTSTDYHRVPTTGNQIYYPTTSHKHSYSGTTNAYNATKNILPPYYALCYIMKLTQISAQAE